MPQFPARPLIFVAHPDDETLALGGLLQRLTTSVVFATDGAAHGYGLGRQLGSLKAYADLRFQEAPRVISRIPNATFNRLARTDGSPFNDHHLFEDLPDAATSLLAIAHTYSPVAILSHAYEGAHIDHDACSFLAMHIAAALSVKLFEFPLYWLDPRETVIRQQFRDIASGVRTDGSQAAAADVIEWGLTETEIQCKKKMLAEYHSQRGTVSIFAPETERMRPARTNSASFLSPCVLIRRTRNDVPVFITRAIIASRPKRC